MDIDENIRRLLAETEITVHEDSFTIVSIHREEEDEARELSKRMTPFSSLTFDPAEISLVKKTVLIVDDEEMILNVGKKMLEKMSHKVFAASSGKEAIEVFKEEKDRIDLVVLDMIMPEMGGKETFERIREINPNVKILISSGYSLEENTSEILEQGGSGFIQKPFTMKELAQKITELFD